MRSGRLELVLGIFDTDSMARWIRDGDAAHGGALVWSKGDTVDAGNVWIGMPVKIKLYVEDVVVYGIVTHVRALPTGDPGDDLDIYTGACAYVEIPDEAVRQGVVAALAEAR